MGFLEDLRAYLERVGREPEGLPYVQLDLARHRRFLIETVDRHFPPSQGKKIVQRWLGFGRVAVLLDGFILGAANRILVQIEPDATSERLGELIDVALALQLRNFDQEPRPATTGSFGKDLVLGNIGLWSEGLADSPGSVDGWLFIPKYALETRLVVRHGQRVVLSRCGRTLTELSGMEAMRWLLTLESAQAAGFRDHFRVSPELAESLVEHPRCPELSELEWPYSRESLRRLAALGLLEYDPDHRFALGYEVFDHAKPILEDIAQRRPTPYKILADALLRDETTQTLEHTHPDAGRVAHESAATAVALQARLVVHEVRNALIPAQVALSSLSSQLGKIEQTAIVERQRARLEGGIQRALDFVDEMLRTTNLGVEPAAPFDVNTAVRDASASLSGDLNGGFQQTVAPEPVLVVGPISRFVLALTNLLRNAGQAIAGVSGGRVSISVEPLEDSILVHVDDSGKGVPAEHRRAIFDAGFALRPGGSGQGLSLVRQVVEGEMRGKVTCTEAPLGGARFTLELARQRVRQP